MSEETLIRDKVIADRLSMSVSWVKSERAKRLRGDPHRLTLDPVYLGRSIRYRSSDLERFVRENFCT